jgi:hypothetical protein
MMGSCVLAIAVLQLTQRATSPSAGVGIIILFVTLAATFTYGFGQLAGSLTRRLPTRSWAIRIVGLFMIVVPAASMGWGLYALEARRGAHEKAEMAAIALFQDQTLTGSFGRHSVTLPVVPSLRLVHACYEGTKQCHTLLWRSAALDSASPDTLELSSIRFHNGHNVLEELNIWCANRQQMLDTVWCELPLESDFSLSVKDSMDPPNLNKYTAHQAPEPIKLLACREHWRGLSCRIRFDLNTDIEGYVVTNGLSPDEAQDEALKVILPRLRRIWAAMSNATQ